MNRIKFWFSHLVLICGVLLVMVTILPVVETNEWWVRVWDFPRPQLFGACIVILLLQFWLQPGVRLGSVIISIGLILAAAFHAWRIIAYTPVWPVEMADVELADIDDCITVMIANVYMENRQSHELLDLITEIDPDILFIVENDAWWSRELHSVSASYDVVLDQPQNNTYGLLFMTNLVAENVQRRHLSDPSIPSILASLQVPSGEAFNFYGLHPKPPRLGQDTDIRDHELMVVAKEVRRENQPSIVGGDLNDVVWSHTTRLFKRVSRMLDPRKGRGLFSSYHAQYPFLRWPLDHLFATDSFQISDFSLLRDIGSDHFPVLAEFCLREDAAEDTTSQDEMHPDDRDELRDTLDSQ